MLTVKVYKAQSIGSHRAQSLAIEIADEVPQTDDLAKSAAILGKDAESIEEALRAALPQGTYYRVLAEMLKRTFGNMMVSLD